MVHVMLFPMFNALYIYISTSRSTCAVSSMAVLCSCLMSCFTCMVLRCVLNDFEMVPVAPIVTGIIFVVYALFLLQGLYVLKYFRVIVIIMLLLSLVTSLFFLVHLVLT